MNDFSLPASPGLTKRKTPHSRMGGTLRAGKYPPREK